MNTPIGLGLIGVGRHGSRYVHHLTNQDVQGAELVAICRRNIQEGVPVPGVRVYGDYRAMLADPLVQAVVVVTHPALCLEICLAAVEHRKPLLVEKPLALTGQAARAMVAAAREAGISLMTAQTMRFDPTVLRTQALLAIVGPFSRVVMTSHIETKPVRSPVTSAPQGALLEFGVHLLDMVRVLTGQEITEARCDLNLSPPAEAETAAKVELKTSGGILCELDIARVESQRVGTMEWLGQYGTVQVDWLRRTVSRTLNQGTREEWTVQPVPTIPATLRAFVHAVRTGSEAPITGLDGCRAVEAADACYRSAREGGRWVAVEPTS